MKSFGVLVLFPNTSKETSIRKKVMVSVSTLGSRSAESSPSVISLKTLGHHKINASLQSPPDLPLRCVKIEEDVPQDISTVIPTQHSDLFYESLNSKSPSAKFNIVCSTKALGFYS